MADRRAHADASADRSAEPDRGPAGAYPGTPRWVKLLGIAVLVVVLLVIIVMVAVGGQHGPGRHLPGGAGGQTPATAQGEYRPGYGR
jgi:hypothetical protein